MSGGECQTKNTKNYDEEEEEKPIVALDEGILLIFSKFYLKLSHIIIILLFFLGGIKPLLPML